MRENRVVCPSCSVGLDERKLVSRTLTIENCPKCGTTVRQTDGFSRTDHAAVTAGDIAEIDTWLENYANETSQKIVKRDLEDGRGFLWAVGTAHDFACECFYDEKTTGFLSMRLVSKSYAEKVLERPERLTDLAARFGLQPYGVRHNGWHISDGQTSDTVWGMAQYPLDTISDTTEAYVWPICTRVPSTLKHAFEFLS